MTPPERPAGVRPIGAPGHMGVDYEERVDFGRLRGYRIARARAALQASECGAFLLFDFYNIRYTTQTWIGGALGDKMIRYALLFRDRDPVLWDFGSAVRHHKLYSRWLPDENWRPGFLGFRGAVAPEAGLMRDAVTEIKSLLTEAGVAGRSARHRHRRAPVPVRAATPGHRGARRPAGDARRPRHQVGGRDHAAQPGGGDGRRRLPGHRRRAQAGRARERDRRAREQATVRARQRPGGGGQLDLGRAMQPASAQLHRPHHPARRPGLLRHHPLLQRLPDLLLPHLRSRQRDARASTTPTRRRGSGWTRRSPRSSPASRTDVVARVLPRAQDFGFENELAAFGLQFAHGLGLGLHERPIISRLNSLENPVELQAGMVFAMETYCPASDGISAARIEEEVVVTDYGTEILTKFPAQTAVRREQVLSGARVARSVR